MRGGPRSLAIVAGVWLATAVPVRGETLVTIGRETYVRHNIRSLRNEYPPPLLWRMLIRYLFEYQYLAPRLGMTRVANPRDYFLCSTWFADDCLATGVLDEAFETLAAAVGRLCACYAVDRTRLRLPTD